MRVKAFALPRCCTQAAAFVIMTLAVTDDIRAQNEGIVASTPAQLKRLSLEELMNLEITSVSKKAEKKNEAAAAVHVITQEDIRRSGARSIPEALRLAPNLQVAQQNSQSWAISARGFNGAASNKMLPLMDGRLLYTPLFSGTFWDVQDYLLDDIERIEVISGPGGTLWGANAINGVINIITKSAKDTQGTLANIGGGTEEQVFGGVRYGGKLGENVYYRAYGKYFNRDSSVFPNGDDAPDDWQMGQGGFRMDWDATEESLLTVQGDFYKAEEGQANRFSFGDTDVSGGNLLARWSRYFSEDSKFQLQAYYDRTHRDIPATFAEDLDTYDIDAQQSVKIGERHDVLFGAGYRFTHDEVENSANLAFLPAELDRHTFSAFVQDEIDLYEHVKLTLGSKFEHNDYTGFEVQPSGRLLWTNNRHVLWTAISRAVRTPSRIDRHLFAFAPGPPRSTVLRGGPNFDSEKLIAYEFGYRLQPHEKVYATISTFFNDYDDLRSVNPVALQIENANEGETYGAELELTWQTTEWWRLTGGYTWLEQDIRTKTGQRDTSLGRAETSDPEQQFLLRSSFDLPRDFEFDLIFRFVDTLHNIRTTPPPAVFGTVSDYMQLDARIAWAPSPHWELSIVGQNLLDEQHPEFGFPSATRREIERGVYAKILWRY